MLGIMADKGYQGLPLLVINYRL